MKWFITNLIYYYKKIELKIMLKSCFMLQFRAFLTQSCEMICRLVQCKNDIRLLKISIFQKSIGQDKAFGASLVHKTQDSHAPYGKALLKSLENAKIM